MYNIDILYLDEKRNMQQLFNKEDKLVIPLTNFFTQSRPDLDLDLVYI